jgi:hypothetical protein
MRPFAAVVNLRNDKKRKTFRPISSSEAKKRRRRKPGGNYAKQITHRTDMPHHLVHRKSLCLTTSADQFIFK